MAIIKCKMCGGEVELSPDKTFGTCEYCGNTMTFPKVDDDQRAAAFNRGNHFRRVGEFDKALSVYERLVEQDDADAEAHWCCALCRFGIEYVEDPATREWLPTCHRASFDSFLEDVDYLAALEHSDGVTRQLYEKDAAKIVQVQRGILATSQNEKPFDVFLCYKETDEQGRRTVDSTLAQDIYYQLTEQGMRVFFARITLEDKAGTEYEPYIFAALNSAKVMVAIGTKPEHFNAVWVKNEWSRYLSMMKKDRHKLLIPCYRGMDPYDLPDELAVLQSYDMARIGFIQDLIRGVRKVVDAEKKPEPREAAPRSEAGGQAAALVRRGYMTLEDGDWAKSDELFENALNLEPENAEAQVGKWLTSVRKKTLAGALRAKREQDFSNSKTERLTAFALDRKRADAAATQHAVPGYLEEDEIQAFYQFDPQYPSKLPALRAARTAAQNWLKNERYLSRARKFAGKDYQKELDDAFGDFLKGYDEAVARAEAEDKAAMEKLSRDYAVHLTQADERAQEAQREAETRREQDYQDACKKFAENSLGDLSEARATFQALGSYKDSAEKARRCEERAEQLITENAYQAACKKMDEAIAVYQFQEAKNAFSKIAAYKDCKDKMRRCDEGIERIQAEEAATYAARERARKKKRNILLIVSATFVTLVVAAILVVTKVIIPSQNYSKAEAFLQAGDTQQAAFAFGKAIGCQDARERSFALWDGLSVRDTLAAGWDHTVGLKADGTVVAVGYNDDGQCYVGGWTDIVAIAAGYGHTVGLKANGTVVAVGRNTEGQCNVDGWTDIVAIAAGCNYTVGLKADGTVVATKYIGDQTYYCGQCDVDGWTDIVAIAAGVLHTVGLKADGTVVVVGSSYVGECNVGGWTDIVAIAAGERQTVGLKADGTVVAVGENNKGQCDVGGWTDIVAIAAASDHTVGLKADGTVVATKYIGDQTYYCGQCDVDGWTDIVAIAAGDDHTVGLKADGTVVATKYIGDQESNAGQCDVQDWRNIKLPDRAQ